MRNIDTNEVKRILEMHSKLKKKPILEQNAPDEDNDVNPNVSGVNPSLNNTPKVDSPKVNSPKVSNDNSSVIPKVNQDEVDLKLIRDAVTAKCLKNGKAQYLKGTKKPVYVVTTVKSGKVVVFYPDMTYKFADGSKSGKWKCDGLQALANQAQQVATQQTTVDTDIARELEQYGWKKREEINVTDTELGQLYQKHPKYNLYKLKIDNSKVGGYTPEQQAFINQWKQQKGYVEKLTPEQLASGVYQKVNVAGSEGLFPGGLIMYKPAAGAQDKKVCRDNVKKYYDYWKTKREDIPQSEFDSLKSQVQACANQFEGKWGGIFSVVDNYIKTLRGGTGGPLSYGEDAKWRLR